MLAIRMQRTGRKGHTQFRVVVQDSRYSPTSGRVVAYVGSYDPHTKTSTLDKEKALKFLNDGAQPSERVALLLKREGVELPNWVAQPSTSKSRSIKNQDKLRRNRPVEEKVVEEAPAETEVEVPAETEAVEAESVSSESKVEETNEPEVVKEPTPANEESNTPAVLAEDKKS